MGPAAPWSGDGEEARQRASLPRAERVRWQTPVEVGDAEGVSTLARTALVVRTGLKSPVWFAPLNLVW